MLVWNDAFGVVMTFSATCSIVETSPVGDVKMTSVETTLHMLT